MSFDLSPLDAAVVRVEGVDRRHDEATAKIDEVLSEPGHAKLRDAIRLVQGDGWRVGEDTREPPPLSSP